MPDTGERTGTTNNSPGGISSPSNAHDGDDSTSASIVQLDTSISNTFIISGYAGDDLPAGATITGIEIRVRAGYATSFAPTQLENVKLSKDGASGTFNNPSTGVAFQHLSDTITDYTFGSSSETWQHTWSGFTDISNLAVSLQVDQQTISGTIAVTAINAVAITVHYEIADVADVTKPGLKINSGKFTIKGGNLTIK